MQKRGEELYEMVRATVEGMGFQLVTVDDLVEHGRRVFRFYVDHPRGMAVEDCASVSREIEYLLDARFDFEGAYVLEVSSPGLDHLLRHRREYAHFKGRRARLVLRSTNEGGGVLEGTLGDADADGVRVVPDTGPEVKVPYEEIAKARLLV